MNHNAKNTQNNNGDDTTNRLIRNGGDLSSRYRERMAWLGYIKPVVVTPAARALTAEELAAKRLFDVNKTLRDWPKNK